MASTNNQTNQQDEQINQMDIDRVYNKFIFVFKSCFEFSSLKEIDEQTETEDETTNSIDSSVSEDEDDSVCSIVMSTNDDNNNSVDLMKNYAIMLEVPTTLTTTNEQI